jgi:RNA recognition motif-containing protein
VASAYSLVREILILDIDFVGVNMKLLVRNLDRSTTEDELLCLFKEYGAVQSCNLVIDLNSGESKGFGFVEMPKVGEAKIAIQSLNNMLVGRNNIRVKKAEPKV